MAPPVTGPTVSPEIRPDRGDVEGEVEERSRESDMQVAALLVDGFGRLAEEVGSVVPGLDTEGLHWRWEGEGNSIAWLVWHLTRIQDDHVAGAFSQEQVWLTGGWQRRFALPLAPRDTGYGHSSDEVAAVRVGSADLLLDYFTAVQEPPQA